MACCHFANEVCFECAASVVARLLKQQDAHLVTIKRLPECDICGKPASCIGIYDAMEGEAPACDECCGHGNEDGTCLPIADWVANNLGVLNSEGDLVDRDRGPIKSPGLWADVRDGSPSDVGWDGDDNGCPRCGAAAGAQCSYQNERGGGTEVGGWIHTERLEGGDLVCSGCNKDIKPEVCGCGSDIEAHSNPMNDGHTFVPLGCDCLRV